MGVWNISEYTPDKFRLFEMEFKDDMLDDWLNSLIYFVYKNDHFKQKYQEILESELERLNPK